MSANIGEWRGANGMSYQDAKARIRKNQAAGTGGANGNYDQGAYLGQLNQRVGANVVAGAWNGKSPIGSNQGYTVMIHPDFLKMMHDDSELGAYYEEQINILADEGEQFKKREEAKGNIIHSQGTYIDENGEMSTQCSFTMTSGGGGNVKTGNKTKSAKELMEELRAKLEEEKEKKKLEEKREDKRALLESLNAATTVTVVRAAGDDAADSVGGSDA